MVWRLRPRESVAPLESISIARQDMCKRIYVMRRGEDIVIVDDYVDDLVFMGNNYSLLTKELIVWFHEECDTSESIQDADRILGVDFKRDRDSKIVKTTMLRKIVSVQVHRLMWTTVKTYRFRGLMKNQELAEFKDTGGEDITWR